MLETSKDILFIVIAFSVLWLTFFLSWLLFYMIMIVKSVYGITKGLQSKLELAERVLTSIKERIEHSASHLTLLVESVGKIVEYVIEKKTKKPNLSKKRKKTITKEEEEE